MSKKKKKREPEAEEERKPFAFMDRYEWVWTGSEWQLSHLGYYWITELFNRHYHFVFALHREFGRIKGWCTIEHADRMICKCWKHPVFSVDPDPMFLRRWLDTWVELQYCRIWQHVFTTLLRKGVDEFDATHRADTLASQFEALYEPTWPRYPKVMKPRRGSKRAKMSDKPADAVTYEQAGDAAKELTEIIGEEAVRQTYTETVTLIDHLELHGPHPSPLLSYEQCYRILDRGDPEPAKHDLKRPGFYDGARVVVLLAGSDPETLKISANTTFGELKRRRVMDFLESKAREMVTPEQFVTEVDAAGDS